MCLPNNTPFIYIIYILAFIAPFTVFSQQTFYTLNYDQNISINKQINCTDDYIHSSFKPLLKSYINQFSNYDSVIYRRANDSAFISKRKYKLIWRKIRTEDLFIIKKEDLLITISPLAYWEYGKEMDTSKLLSVNTRGFIIKADIGKKVSIASTLYENQAFYPRYVTEYVNKHLVAPGQGSVKLYKTDGFDFSSAAGYISYSPCKVFNVQFGNGKNFIGEGYRSLLLSDASYNYPFIKLTTTYKRIQYINMFTAFQDAVYGYSRINTYKRKHGSFNYLNWIVCKRFQIGFFEGIILHTADSTYNNRFKLNYFNPVIYERLFQYGLNDDNNMLIGLNFKLKLWKPLQLYGQIVIDKNKFNKKYDGEVDRVRNGFQLGLKYFNMFTVKNLYFQIEYNQVRPFTYSHRKPLQSYTNFNEPLAHPLGANYKETVVILNYKYKDFFIDARYNYANTYNDITYGLSNGTNILISPEYCYVVAAFFVPPTPINITHYTAMIGYIIKPVTNMQIFAGINYRTYNAGNIKSESNYIFFGFRTYINNLYFDF